VWSFASTVSCLWYRYLSTVVSVTAKTEITGYVRPLRGHKLTTRRVDDGLGAGQVKALVGWVESKNSGLG